MSKYTTTADSCSCLDYRYRQADIGGKCKHMKELEQ
jgi:hypothetical protein